ncbi:hypothetical protein AWM75_05865 [Aerococcus urinaehominis]|uniref:Uncharacterized protein n=2 Tax=Aerococcus urinaehominis TaxID=128944 RepID=A0A109RHX1_9LACT|nr:hypothetical protein AWM75_05865 [Aerococcus urinaehominis]SDM34815.1 Glycosyltransferase involved in cell wall bisynthesis [Aerococcus urinaehominis]
MRILQIMSGFGGGISSFIMNKAKQMPKYGVIFDVATYDECNQEFEQAISGTGGQIYRLANPKKAGYQAFKRSLLLAFEAHHYDAVHCHIAGYRALAYYHIAHPFVDNQFYLHAHTVRRLDTLGRKGRLLAAVERRINSHLSKAYLGCGRMANQSFYRLDLPESEMMVVPNSIEAQDFILSDQDQVKRREQLKAQLAINPNSYLIGHIGRLVAVKNHEKTLEIAALAKNQGLNLCFLIIGSGPRESELQKLVDQRGLSDYVKFTGRLAPISAYFAGLDALLLPSFTEGFPTTIVESQAAGVPALVSNRVTDEVDFGIDLVTYLPLEADSQVWLKHLLTSLEQAIPDSGHRMQVLEAKRFTNQASAQLYVDFMAGRISHFHL